MVANKGTTATAEPITNPRLPTTTTNCEDDEEECDNNVEKNETATPATPTKEVSTERPPEIREKNVSKSTSSSTLPTTTTNCEDDEEECDNNVEKNETATPATPTKEVSTERPPEIREKNVSKSTSSSTLPTTTTNCEDDEEECDNNVEKNETATPALIACSITHSWSAPELTVTGSLYCKGKPIVHTRVALLDGEYGYNMDDQVTGQEGNFSLRVKTKNEELNRKDWYFHAEPDCGRKAYQIQVNVLKNKCMARGSARIDVESIQPSTGEVIVEEYNLD
nr:unnamed protein product [Haemonchus contortus]